MLDDDDDVHIGPHGNAAEGEWMNISAVADSGAEVHALLEEASVWIPLEPSAHLREGCNFTVANHTKNPSQGQEESHRHDGEQAMETD